jgi:hypothetical protein
MAEFTDSEIKLLLSRIHNWRRYYRNVQRIQAVSYYTPPRYPEDSEAIVKMPVYLLDASRLESVWSSMDGGSAKKWFILWKYIKQHQYSQIRRQLKQYGEKLRTAEEFDNFNKRALETFWRKLGE